MHLGIEKGGSAGTRAFESCAVLLMGIASSLGWSYAIKNRRLLSNEVTDKEARDLGNRIQAEPISALITIPFAFAHGILWEISWLSYIPVLFLLKRRGRNS
jgi:hypothetical protein